MTNIGSILASPDTGLAEDSVTLCLAGKALREWRELKGQTQAPEGIEADTRMGRRSASKLGAEDQTKADKLEKIIRAHTIKFVVRALPGPQWNELYAAHPPRKGDDGNALAIDAQLGLNPTTFYRALAALSIISPEMTPEQWSQLVDKMSDVQFDKISTAAYMVNRRDTDVPFEPAS